MENDYIKYFLHKQASIKSIFWAFLLIIVLGIPIWFYTYSYFETADFGIEKLGVERYNERNRDALLVAFFLLIVNSLIALPIIIFVNTFFNNYKSVLQQLNPEEIKTLEKINNVLRGFDKFMPSFILTAQNIHFFSFKQHTIPLESIKKYSINRVRMRYSYAYNVKINTSDGKNYSFQVSNNHSQLDYLKVYLEGKTYVV